MGVKPMPDMLSLGFALDEDRLRLAEDSAKYFVLGSVGSSHSVDATHQAPPSPNPTTSAGAQPAAGAPIGSPSLASAAPAPAVAPSPMRTKVNLPPAPTTPAPVPKASLQVAPPKHELWANMFEEGQDQPTVTPPSTFDEDKRTDKDEDEDNTPESSPDASSPPGGEAKYSARANGKGGQGVQAALPKRGVAGKASQAKGSTQAEKDKAALAARRIRPVWPEREAPAGAGAAAASPSGRELCGLPKTWANVAASGSPADSLSTTGYAALQRRLKTSEPRARKDTILDFLLYLADQKGLGDGFEPVPEETPPELKRFEKVLESGCNNISKAMYNRRGMKNEANNCYVNVVIQSLLPCSALMQLLSHCAPNDGDRIFYTGMVRLCKEFHSRKNDVEPCNVLFFPQVQEIISTWQSIGAQQDAGEFLFYMLNGMHEECKWKVAGTAEGDEQVRSAGANEDSPIVRIFGGLFESSVRSRSATTDSVSVEPFNHLILDISSPHVDSVWTALDAAYCGAEAVHEGQATKRLRLRMLPKVLVMSLNRFSYNKDTGSTMKIKKPIKYEEKLVPEASWLVDGLEPPEYQLTAVICHHGESPNGGHYNAAVRYNGDWFMYDDAIVRQTDMREVLSHQFTAYLLLYQCAGKVLVRP